MNVRFVGRKNADAKTVTLYCRVTINGTRQIFSTGVTTSTIKWNPKTQKVKGSDAINSELDNIKMALIDIKARMFRQKEIITSQKIVNYFLKPEFESITLINLYQKFSDYTLKVGKVSEENHRKKYGGFQKDLELFLKEKGLTQMLAAEVNVKFVDDFYSWLLTDGRHKKNHVNTAAYKMGKLRGALSFGVRSQAISYNIMFDMAFKKEKNKEPKHLTKEQLQHLELSKFGSENRETAKDLFLFQCYTGLAYVDMSKLDINEHFHVINGVCWLMNQRSKTQVGYKVPLNASALAILRKYNSVLPKMTYRNYRLILADIATSLSIPKITSHMGRHTFAVHMLNKKGVSSEVTSRMMGHSSPKITTDTYASVMLTKIQSELDDILA